MDTARLRALDLFRGAAVALMILVNNPGSWDHLYPPLAHAAWHGLTPTDLVFPFFLFAVGNTLALMAARLRDAPAAVFWRRVLWRTAAIFALGLLLNASPFVRWNEAGELVMRDWHAFRTMGVLQRIAMCFGVAAVIVRLGGVRGALQAAVFLLTAYWIACHWLGAPGDPYSLSGWFGTAIDRALLGESHLYRGEGVPFDPEGLASTAPAIAQVLLGYLAGEAVRRVPQPDAALVARLFSWAALLGVAGYGWQLEMPLNKKIWTGSYVLVTTALALVLLAWLLYVVDVRRRPREQWLWARGLEVFGRNALFVFVLSGLVPRVLALLRFSDPPLPFTTPLRWLYDHVFATVGGDPRFGSLLYALAQVAAYGSLAWWLDRRRIYIRV